MNKKTMKLETGTYVVREFVGSGLSDIERPANWNGNNWEMMGTDEEWKMTEFLEEFNIGRLIIPNAEVMIADGRKKENRLPADYQFCA